MRHCFLLIIICIATSCSVQKKVSQSSENINSLKFINEYDVPYNFSFKGTTVGGLSGIDHDEATGIYYMICDDRSAINPARFYSAQIKVSSKGIDTVIFNDVKFLHQRNGELFPDNKKDPFHVPDPEAIRFDAVSKNLVWTSEGERIIRSNGQNILADPSINIINTEGKFIDSFPIPAFLKMQAIQKGPRQNGVLEGMTFSGDHKKLFVNIEEPIFEDGPRAGLEDSTGIIRILEYDVASKTLNNVYRYVIDPVPYDPTPINAFRINGVPDIFAVAENKLIVIERAFSTGRIPCTVKVYGVELSANSSTAPLQKKLLLNMESLGIFIDNIEGVCFGPTLPNGHRTLVFISDNNFSSSEKTQLLLFEIL
jgi:hypothetical protein